MPRNKLELKNEDIRRMGDSCLFVDPDKGKSIHFYNLSIYPDISNLGDSEKYTRIFIQISNDGEEYNEPIQLIQKGYDENNWAQGITYGENSIVISFCTPIKLKNGKILLPAILPPVRDDLSNQFKVCSFIGEWKDSAIEWELSNMVKIDSSLCEYGLDESTIAELSNGDILMVCRSSYSSGSHQPCCRWCSVSKDGGHTWSEAYAMKYDSGEDVLSTISSSTLIRHSKNGEL